MDIFHKNKLFNNGGENKNKTTQKLCFLFTFFVTNLFSCLFKLNFYSCLQTVLISRYICDSTKLNTVQNKVQYMSAPDTSDNISQMNLESSGET